MERIAIVEGIRTPFVKAWSLFEDVPAQRLGAIAVRELLEIAHLEPALVDEVIFGAVSQPIEASNVGRVIALLAGIPKDKKAYTLSRNCASGLEAITSAAEKIWCGQDNIVVAGGTESMSNIPLVFSRELARLLLRLGKAKGLLEKMRIFSQARPAYFKPVVGLALGLTDPVCGLNMGQTAEILAKEFGITRMAQDEFALTSHRRAVAGRAKLREEIVPVIVPPRYDVVVEDDYGPRDNQTLEALAFLRPYFDSRTGSVTVGNSCQVTDGACCVLVMSEERARQHGYEPLGYIRAYEHVGLEPHRMGLGPAFAIPRVLNRAGLRLTDIDLFEINEAFAAQVLVCLDALSSRKFAAENFGLGEPVGVIDLEKLNVNGGAIALGHPVGTTGARLVLTLLRELKRRDLKFGLASMCVGGGQGGAIILERR